ncbi:hypothetical protein KUTeg_002354 [Tegillarca granosa]|uniref:Uncharacterized protein n=1 Tax=Tegillarca granosa TaxID=220873 RepID=A0ABQ9FU37_TEGGR|nr:hypothetical protein KUTeg_002354 [Tegillarca granosa]
MKNILVIRKVQTCVPRCSEMMCSRKCDNNMNVCSNSVTSNTCENSCCLKKQNLVSDSSKQAMSKQIVEVQPFIHKPSVKTSTPVVKKSNRKVDNLSTNLVTSPCVKVQLHLEDSFLGNIESPFRDVHSSSPKFCSTPVTSIRRHSDSVQFFSFDNESSIYTELMKAEEDYGRKVKNVKNKCDTYSLSSSYYSESDESSMGECRNNFDDQSIITECSRLKKQVKKPLNCSSVEILLDETQIVFDALKKYKKELDISEAKFNLSHMILDEELSNTEKDSIRELKFLRSEIRKEIEIMERQLEHRSKSLNEGCQNFNPLVCLEVVDKMMELISLTADC